MARKAAKREGRTGITSSAVDPLNKLPIHKRNYVLARANGATIGEAAAQAGVGQRQGGKYETEADIQAAYRSLMRKAIPAQKLVNLIKGGCNATMPVYAPNGQKRERADWKTRRGYIELATKHAGFHEDRDSNSGVAINLTVNHIGQPQITTHKKTIDAN